MIILKMEFNLTLYSLFEPLYTGMFFFFSAVSQVINNVKNLPVNLLSPIFTVTNYNKKKYCIQIIQDHLWCYTLNLRTFIDLNKLSLRASQINSLH